MDKGMKKNMIKVLGVAALLSVTIPACADTYSYTDASGTIHFVEDASLVPKKYRKQARHRAEDVYTESSKSEAATPQPAGSTGQQYSLETVNICLEGPEKKKEKDYLDFVKFMKERQIPFATYDMKNDKTICTQIWCDHFVRSGGAEAMRVHPDECLPVKLKSPPSAPFVLHGDTLSYSVSRYSLSY